MKIKGKVVTKTEQNVDRSVEHEVQIETEYTSRRGRTKQIHDRKMGNLVVYGTCGFITVVRWLGGKIERKGV